MAIDTLPPVPPRIRVPAPSTSTARGTGHWGLRGPLIGLAAFQAVTAIPSALFVVPTMPREVLTHGPITLFSDYTIPALALGVLCGGGALAALGAVLVRPRLGALASVTAGLFMVGFELVQMAAIGVTARQTPADLRSWLQEVYIVVGGAMVILGARLWKAETGAYRPRRQALS